MQLRTLRNADWRTIGRSDEHPDFCEPSPTQWDEALAAEAERAEDVAEYVRWFGDETEDGDRRLRTAIENSLP